MVPEFKSVQDVIAFLEEGNTLEGQELIETLKAVTAKKSSGQRRGQLAGLTVEEMSDEQLKREIINANSVLYKAIQRGASEDTIAKNQARVDAAKAEKEKRTPEAPVAEEVAADAPAEDTVYNDAVEAEL
jgi:hypothetical protein